MKKIIPIILFPIFLFQAVSFASAGPGEVDFVTVKTNAPSNRELKIYYRVPANYEPDSGRLYRVLVVFGGRNCTGEAQAAGGLGFAKWADIHDVFIVAPGFKDDDYWYPEKWSGKALFKGLAEMKKKYKILPGKLMTYGYSGGSQCANLFPAWKPKMFVAWASHACGVWHKPTVKMKDCPGLATCGDADAGRYILTQRFVIECRKKGENVLWKSFPNTPHEVPPDSVKLAKIFLKIHHERNLADLKIKGCGEIEKSKDKILFVGDDQEGRFWPIGSREIKNIDLEDRVEFTSRELAEAWGKEAKSRWADSFAAQ